MPKPCSLSAAEPREFSSKPDAIEEKEQGRTGRAVFYSAKNNGRRANTVNTKRCCLVLITWRRSATL
jgi:hypothetical protein